MDDGLVGRPGHGQGAEQPEDELTIPRYGAFCKLLSGLTCTHTLGRR